MTIDVNHGGPEGGQLTPPLDHWDPAWQYPLPHAYWAITPALKRFYKLVAAEYTPSDTVGQWIVYHPNTAYPEHHLNSAADVGSQATEVISAAWPAPDGRRSRPQVH